MFARRSGAWKSYGRATYLSSPIGMMSMQSPGLRLNAQSLRGTPVMMFLLEIVYDLDWRMMSGCDTRELEQNLIRNLKRHKASTFNPLPESGTYIIGPAFNNNLYLENNKDGNTRQYVFNKKQMPHSVANLMLADDMPNEAYADITFSLYDNTSNII